MPSALTLRIGHNRVYLGDFRVEGPRGSAALTPMEGAVMQHLASRLGEVVSRATLEREVWGHREGVMSEAVPVLMRRLRAKIEDTTTGVAGLETVRGVGWRLLASVETTEEAPAPGRRWFGRNDELAELERSAQRPLVVLHGPPGVGKTALARRYQRGQGQSSAFVDLVGARDGLGLRAAVQRALGLESASLDEDALATALGARGPFLLVLDNFEQLAEACTPRLEAWLRRAPDLRLLVTSRSRLGTPAEHVVEVLPLATQEALELFCDRAGPHLQGIDRDDARVLVEAVDCLPLAVELLAHRCSVLRPRELLARLNRRLDLASKVGEPGRHGTLRAAVESSWEDLDADAQDVLAQASVFASPFDLAAAEAVLKSRGFLIDVLQLLVDRALLRRRFDLDDRFELLVTLRDFARERLAERSLEAETLRTHRTHVLEAFEPFGGGRYDGRPVRVAELAPLRTWLPDLRDIVDRSVDAEPEWAARAALALGLLGSTFGPRELSRTTLERVLAREDLLSAPVLADLAAVAAFERDHVSALELLGRARAALGDQDPRRLARLLLCTWTRLATLGRYEEARGLAAEVRRLVAETGDEDLALRNEWHAAIEESYRGRVEAARTLAAHMARAERAQGDAYFAAMILHLVAPSEQRAWAERAAQLALEEGSTNLWMRLQGALAELRLDAGELAAARELAWSALPAAERAGDLPALDSLWNVLARHALETRDHDLLRRARAAGAALPSGFRFRRFHGGWVRMQAFVALDAGDPGTAAAAFQRLCDDPALAVVERLSDLARGAAAHALAGDGARAAALAADAVQMLTRTGFAPRPAFVVWLTAARALGVEVPAAAGVEASVAGTTWEERLCARVLAARGAPGGAGGAPGPSSVRD